MPKVKFNKLIESLSGRVGDMVFYQADGQNLSRAVGKVNSERSAKQGANESRFKQAQVYARAATADPIRKAAYQARCVGHQNARNLAIRDFMIEPVIESLNLEGYTGKPAQPLRVRATDDFGVVQVQITIRDPQGNLIEEGLGQLNTDQKEWWYQSQAEVTPGQTVSVTAVAKDSPGNTVSYQRWHYVGAAAAP